MKLLSKTTRTYLTYAAILLLAAIPVNYFFIRSIVQEDVDEGLQASKNAIAAKLTAENLDALAQFPGFSSSVMPADVNDLTEKNYDSTAYDSAAKEMIPYRVLSSPVQVGNRNFRLKLSTSLVDKNDLVFALTAIQVILLLLLLTGLALLNKRLSRQIWTPFYQLIERLRNYQLKNGETLKLPHSPIDEFRDLQISVEELTNRASASYRQQRQFTEQASHELQTPLAIMQGQLDLLMQTELEAEQAALIESIDEALQRLQRLNKSLLLLTRIDHQRFPENENVQLAEQVNKVCLRYEPLVKEKGLSIPQDIDSEIAVHCNRALLDSLLSNLLINSIRHNCADGEILVSLKQNYLLIRNSGLENNLNWDADADSERKPVSGKDGLGLGLEIVKSICRLYNWKISYHYLDCLHGFTILFPMPNNSSDLAQI